jgi:DnaK suppressor protein
MSRKDALLRLHERLIAKRNALRAKLSDDRDVVPVNSGTGDVGDVANDGAQTELNSQLAALETRELHQIERAIELIRLGRYGKCEICTHSIPVTRLNALPYTLVCIECQRQQEERGDNDLEEVDWASAYEHEGRMNDAELTLGDLDLEG